MLRIARNIGATLDSRVGRGSVFRIGLPPGAAQESTQAPRPAPGTAHLAGLRVLVVEDAVVRDATAVLMKPVAPDALRAALQAVVAQRTAPFADGRLPSRQGRRLD